MNKKQLQSEHTRKKIMDASRPFFIQKGYKATCIEDIVSTTGCSAGNIYYHFKSKEGLFLSLLEEMDREWDESWRARKGTFSTISEELYEFAKQLALDQMNHPLVKAADEFYTESEKASDIKERMDRMVSEYLRFNRELLQRGIDSGEFAMTNVADTATILDSLLYGLSQHARRMNQEEALATYRLAIDVVLHGVAKR
ncbi:TetR/AcrR family transcriptional regulator [Gorillibacterium timonense]|uniref:TetR/AcrR family transcriptional regulator n=1 Tax=Gorillibacterium timonense TaxID=1689269 RepID=UPI00071D9BCA|nr:TetR/AcrR family transcriptional regulator [Gorillibacterium timonense]